jgi:hypothetical protein
MKMNRWTVGLAAVGLVSLSSVVQAEEKQVPLMTALSSTTLSGYISTSAIWRPGNGVATPGRLFDGNYPGVGINKQDGFNVDVVSLTLDKPLDEGQWSAGYHVQALLGPDATLRGTGLNGGATDFALHEAYVALRAPVGNGLDFRIGQFTTFVGYESYDYYKNPNYSRSYAFGIEPNSHVGVTASYTFNEIVSAMVGIANSSSSFINSKAATQSAKYYMALVTLTAPEATGFLKGSTLSLGYQNGAADASTGSTTHQVNYYAGFNLATPVAGLNVGAAFDYADNINGAANRAQAYGLYVSYQATEKLKLNTRAEWAEGSPGVYGETAKNVVGDDDQLVALTLTADYALWQNVITRGEVRWDHDIAGNNGIGGYDNSLTFALNVIYKF